MKKVILLLLLGAWVFTSVAQEKVFQVNEVSVINYGDGRLLFRELNEEKTPLQGEYRIIDGYHSEYILASFKNGMYDGLYRHFKRNVLAEESTYKDGWREGYRKTYYGDGKTLQGEGTFVEGKLHGVCKSYYQNGKVETEVCYKMGDQDGCDRKYEEGSLVRDTYYKDSKPDGNWVEHLSGSIDFTRRSSYKNGLLTSEYSETLKNGNLRKKGTYKEGKKDGIWIEYRRDTGIPERSTTYRAGEKTGEEIRYFTDGKPESSKNYLNGKLEGISREYYYSNGQLKSEFTYKANKQHGPFKYLNGDGTVREAGRYENDMRKE